MSQVIMRHEEKRREGERAALPNLDPSAPWHACPAQGELYDNQSHLVSSINACRSRSHSHPQQKYEKDGDDRMMRPQEPGKYGDRRRVKKWSQRVEGVHAHAGVSKFEQGDIWSKRRDDKYKKFVRKAKRAARSELSVSKGQWSALGYAQQGEVLDVSGIRDGLERIDSRNVSFLEFRYYIESKGIPAVITHLCDHWPATKGAWSEEALLRKFKNHRFKVGSDDDGYAVRMKLKHFIRYCHDDRPGGGLNDDSPLYIFDSTFVERQGGSDGMVRDYTPPFLFAEDLLQYAGERRRPPYRWIVSGPPRSGTSIHVDPLGTSAWNSTITGRKRWALFPPSTPKARIKPPEIESEAVEWFVKVWPRTQREDWPCARPIDVIQHPGETMFVPGGWWHVVMNLDFSTAITQNFCSSSNFSAVFKHCRVGRPKMTQKWLRVLSDERPDLATKAISIIESGETHPDTSSCYSSSRAAAAVIATIVAPHARRKTTETIALFNNLTSRDKGMNPSHNFFLHVIFMPCII